MYLFRAHILGLIFWCVFSLVSYAESAYLSDLIQKASEQRIHEDRYWHILLHYKKTWLGYESRMDDPSFFLAENGKTNPEAELAATLRSFFQLLDESMDHPICRFTARFTWLVETLGIDRARLPLADCPDYLEIIETLNPSSAALIYPAAHINGPASMFGHTLLVIDSKGQDRVLSKAINYAASIDTRFGPLFAVKGILGLYPGIYTILPYYDKIEQYSAISRRDIWEYELDLSEPQLERLMRHAWEMQNRWSDYFFFSENCASELLYFIEAARPEIVLRDEMRVHAIPMDTVKLVSKHGLVRNQTYRPSKGTRIEWLGEKVGLDYSEKVRNFAKGKATLDDLQADEENVQRAVYDLAAEYTQFLYTEKAITPSEYRSRYFEVLKKRSKMGKAKQDWREVPWPARPEEGHAPGRLQFGMGMNEEEEFYTFQIRPAYHELIDPEHGYLRGAQIQFLNLEGRYFPDRDEVELKSADLIDVFSVTAYTDFFKPTSWDFYTGVALQDLNPRDEYYVYRNRLGGGAAVSIGSHVVAYGMINSALEFSGRYDSDVAVGLGGSLGFLTTWGNYQNVLRVQGLEFSVGMDTTRWHVEFEQALRVSERVSLQLKYAFEEEEDLSRHEVALGWYQYF